jgi:hypothetical protein
MLKYIVALMLLASTGCACSSCFTKDVRLLYEQEKETVYSAPSNIKQFMIDEFSGVYGIRRDLTAGTQNETLYPNYYFNATKDILCPCP